MYSFSFGARRERPQTIVYIFFCVINLSNNFTAALLCLLGSGLFRDTIALFRERAALKRHLSEDELLCEEPHKLLVVQPVVVVSVHLADQLLHLDKEEVTLHPAWTKAAHRLGQTRRPGRPTRASVVLMHDLHILCLDNGSVPNELSLLGQEV